MTLRAHRTTQLLDKACVFIGLFIALKSAFAPTPFAHHSVSHSDASSAALVQWEWESCACPPLQARRSVWGLCCVGVSLGHMSKTSCQTSFGADVRPPPLMLRAHRLHRCNVTARHRVTFINRYYHYHYLGSLLQRCWWTHTASVARGRTAGDPVCRSWEGIRGREQH